MGIKLCLTALFLAWPNFSGPARAELMKIDWSCQWALPVAKSNSYWRKNAMLRSVALVKMPALVQLWEKKAFWYLQMGLQVS